MLITNPFSAEALRDRLQGELVLSTDEGYDAARQGWNLAADLRPAMVAQPACAEDVSELVIFARENGLRIVMQGTGHNATPLGDMDDVILVRTGAMRGVEIDPVRRVARVEAGAVWADVTAPASEHGLAALAGSAPDVGVVGYVVGGGLGWLGRRYGLACERVLSVRRRHGRRPARPRRSRQRARPLLGAARRRRVLRGDRRPGDGARPRAERDRRHDALRLGARPRGRPGLARVDGRRPRDGDDVVPDHAGPRHADAPRVRARARRRGHRRRGPGRRLGGRGDPRAAARAGAGARHVRRGPAGRALPHPHGPRGPDALGVRARDAARADRGGRGPRRRRVRPRLGQPAHDGRVPPRRRRARAPGLGRPGLPARRRT